MKRLLIVVLGAVLSLVALTGCQSPSTMAYVNGSEISVDEYTYIANGIEAAGQPLDEESRAGVATNLIQFEIIDQYAAQEGLTVPEEDIEAELAKQAEQAAAAGVELSGGALEYYRRYTRATLLLGNLDQQQFGTLLAEADVDLNPRYGAWGPAGQAGTFAVLPGFGSLAIPAEANQQPS